MTFTVLTYGDSNTHGTPPMTSLDNNPRITSRWPVVMAQNAQIHLIEEGLPGRLAAGHGDPFMGVHMNGSWGYALHWQATVRLMF